MKCPHCKVDHKDRKNLLRYPRTVIEILTPNSKKYLCFKCGHKFLNVMGLKFTYEY